jgi:hypothetical protein
MRTRPSNLYVRQGGFRGGDLASREIADQHDQMSAYVLHAGVPPDIAVQFETARNPCAHRH